MEENDILRQKEEYTKKNLGPVFNGLFMYATAAQLFQSMAEQILLTRNQIPAIETSFSRGTSSDYQCNDIRTLLNLCMNQRENAKDKSSNLLQAFLTLIGEKSSTEAIKAMDNGRTFATQLARKINKSSALGMDLLRQNARVFLPNFTSKERPLQNMTPQKREAAFKLYSYCKLMQKVIYPYMEFIAAAGSIEKSALSKNFSFFPYRMIDYINWLCQNDEVDSKVGIVVDKRLATMAYAEERPKGPLARLVYSRDLYPATIVASHCFGAYDALNQNLPYPIIKDQRARDYRIE